MLQKISLFGLATLMFMFLAACGTAASPVVSIEEPGRSNMQSPAQDTTSAPIPSASESVKTKEIIMPRASQLNVIEFLGVRFEGPQGGESANVRGAVVIYQEVIGGKTTGEKSSTMGYTVKEIAPGETMEFRSKQVVFGDGSNDGHRVAQSVMRGLIYDASVGDRGFQNQTEAYEALEFWGMGDEVQDGDRFVIYPPVIAEVPFLTPLDYPLGTIVEVRERSGDVMRAVVYVPGEDPWEMKFRPYPQDGPTLSNLARALIYPAIPKGYEFSEGDRVFVFPMEYKPGNS